MQGTHSTRQSRSRPLVQINCPAPLSPLSAFYPLAPIAMAVFTVLMAGSFSAAVRAQTVSASATELVAINIPAQPLAQALNQLADQMNLQLNAPVALTAGRQTSAVIGNLTAQQALDRLLVGSGLESSVSGNQISVRQVTTAIAPGEVALAPVIVTGTKLDQGLQQATQAVSVFKESDLVGLQSNLEVFQRVPNVGYVGSNQMPVVRGLVGNGLAYGGGGAVTGSQPRVTSYVDAYYNFRHQPH